MGEAIVGIVIPTLGTRPNYLIQALTSIRSAGECLIYVVTPQPQKLQSMLETNLYDKILLDPGTGLSSAIDYGLRAFPAYVNYTNWLGDDDLLVPDSITHALSIISKNEHISFVFGRCQYIDEDGKNLWLNKSGAWASSLMRFGPQLIPQPGALFRRDRYLEIGGLNPELKWAFDLDLLIRLSQVGELRFTPMTLAKFRWHQGSLSVGGRAGSVVEASAVRTAALPRYLQGVSFFWEKPLQMLIRHGGSIVKHL